MLSRRYFDGVPSEFTASLASFTPRDGPATTYCKKRQLASTKRYEITDHRNRRVSAPSRTCAFDVTL